MSDKLNPPGQVHRFVPRAEREFSTLWQSFQAIAHRGVDLNRNLGFCLWEGQRLVRVRSAVMRNAHMQPELTFDVRARLSPDDQARRRHFTSGEVLDIATGYVVLVNRVGAHAPDQQIFDIYAPGTPDTDDPLDVRTGELQTATMLLSRAETAPGSEVAASDPALSYLRSVGRRALD